MDDFERGYEAAMESWQIQKLIRFVEYVSSGGSSDLAVEASAVLAETDLRSSRREV